jgi:hypothetical protein
LSRQIDHLLDEEFDLNLEITYTLKILVEAQWDSNTLKVKLEELISQHDMIYSELDKIGFYDKPSEGPML